MEIEKLTKFKDLLAVVHQINGMTTPDTYFYITKNIVTRKSGLSLCDLVKCDFVIVVGTYLWKNFGYTNCSAKLIGFFNHDLEPIDSIKVNDRIRITGIEFTKYRSSYYNEYKPIFICEKPDGEQVNLTYEGPAVERSEEFQNLYNKANEL